MGKKFKLPIDAKNVSSEARTDSGRRAGESEGNPTGTGRGGEGGGCRLFLAGNEKKNLISVNFEHHPDVYDKIFSVSTRVT